MALLGLGRLITMTRFIRSTSVACAMALLCAAPAAAKPRADLVGRSVGSPPATLQPGGSFSLSEKVSKRGARRAKAAVGSYPLARDRKLSADDLKIGQR